MKQEDQKIKEIEEQIRLMHEDLDKAHKDFGKSMREVRSNRNLPLIYLADKIGVSVAFLSDVERGRRNATNIMRSQIAKYL